MYKFFSKDEFLASGAFSVGRADDNSGTFVFDKNDEVLGFVGNHESADGTWLYYSDDVLNWLGLSVKRPRVWGNSHYFSGFVSS